MTRIRSRPVETTLRLKALMMRSSASAAEGWYDPRTHSRQVTPGPDARSGEARMASLHEMHHAYLNDSTGYGTAMILVGALAEREPDRFEPFLTALLAAAIGCHEDFATAASVFIASRGAGYDATLLLNYPEYQENLEELTPILEAAPHPILAHIAIENLARAAMQTGLDRRLAQTPVEAWPTCAPTGLEKPDVRFEALISEGFLKCLFRAEPPTATFDAVGGLKDGSTSASAFQERFEKGALDETLTLYGRHFYALARHRLRALGGACLDYDGHTEHTRSLLDVAADRFGDALLRRYRTPSGGEDELALILGDFAHEALVLSAEPLPAILVRSDDLEPEEAANFLIGPEDAPWVQVIAQPKERLARQYRFDPESRETLAALAEDPVTLLRRRVVDPNTQGLIRIDLAAFATPEALKAVAERWPRLKDCVTIATVRALQSDAWRATWMGIFQSFGVAPILMDVDPFEMMKRWRALERPFKIGRASTVQDLDDAPSMMETVCWRPENEGVLFFAPVSGTVAAALMRHGRQWPEIFEEDDAFLNEESTHERLTYALTHVLREERIFEFGLK